MSKHTPGPWVRAANYPNGMTALCQHDGKGWRLIADCGAGEFGNEQNASNAKLMSLSPLMFEAIKALVDCDFGSNGWDEAAEHAAQMARDVMHKIETND